jgi:hypothetical protein
MNAVLAPTPAIQARTASAMNSGPWSDRIYAGTPRSRHNAASISITSALLSRRATLIARHSRVNSSIRHGMRYFLPSWVRSSTKS